MGLRRCRTSSRIQTARTMRCRKKRIKMNNACLRETTGNHNEVEFDSFFETKIQLKLQVYNLCKRICRKNIIYPVSNFLSTLTLRTLHRISFPLQSNALDM